MVDVVKLTMSFETTGEINDPDASVKVDLTLRYRFSADWMSPPADIDTYASNVTPSVDDAVA